MCCSIVLNMCRVSDYKNVEKVQERALHYVLSDFNYIYCHFCKENQDTLWISRLRILAIQIFKVLNDISDLYMKNLFFTKYLLHMTYEICHLSHSEKIL